MVSKHSAVRSIRLQNTDWEWLAAEAERRGTTVNGLVAEGVAMVRDGQPQIANAPNTHISGDGQRALAPGRPNNQSSTSVREQIRDYVQSPADPGAGQARTFGPVPRKPGSMLKQKGPKH